MHAIEANKDKIILELSKNELGVLGNALNEVCNGIEVPDFDTKIGVKTENASLILDSLISIYIKTNQIRSIDDR